MEKSHVKSLKNSLLQNEVLYLKNVSIFFYLCLPTWGKIWAMFLHSTFYIVKKWTKFIELVNKSNDSVGLIMCS